jgi:hypothetical protein
VHALCSRQQQPEPQAAGNTTHSVPIEAGLAPATFSRLGCCNTTRSATGAGNRRRPAEQVHPAVPAEPQPRDYLPAHRMTQRWLVAARLNTGCKRRRHGTTMLA